MATGTAIVMQAGWQIETLAGDLDAAERAARQGVEQLEQLGERAWLSTSACQLAEALYSLGRLEEAEYWVLRGLDLGGAGDILTQLLGLGIRAKLLARDGGFDEALVVAQRAVALAATTQAPMEMAQAILALAEVLYLSGDKPGAFEQSGRAVAVYESKRGPAGVAHVRRVEASWAAALPATG
jgi:tetratricopeptide (TPR) repeat protein